MTEKLKVGDYVEIFWFRGPKQQGAMMGFGKIVKRNKQHYPVVKYYDLNCVTDEMSMDEENLFKISPSQYKKYLADWKRDCKR